MVGWPLTQAAVLALVACAGLVAASSTQTRTGAEILDAILRDPQPVKAAPFFRLKADEITALSEATISRLDANLNATAASVSKPSWAATMQPLVDNDAISAIVSPVVTFPSSVSTDPAARNASLVASTRVSQWAVDAGLREDVYQALKAFNATPAAAALTGEQARYLNFSMRDSRRAGLELPKPKRDELAGILKQMAKLGIEFSACLDEDTTNITAAPAELNGTAPDFVAGLKKDPGNASQVIVTVKYPDYFPVMQDCTVEATRKRLEFAFNNVCAKDNVVRLDRLVALRAKAAAVLGYDTWAAYVQEVLMAKSPERVKGFLADLRGKLLKLRDRQFDVLLKYKRQEKEAQGKKFDGAINSWDTSYYSNMVEKRDFKVDSQEVQKYFPMEHVVPELLGVYQGILGLTFKADPALSNASWAPGVEAFEVYDSKSKELLGVFYLDLHPRAGKFGHAAMFGLQPPSTVVVDGKPQRAIGVGALVCNFPESTPAQPSLLRHDDVTTLFHEMGHMFHQILGRTNLSTFAGTSVDTDFVEAPSQMLENWTWEPEVLRRITKHYKTGKQMPEDLIAKLVKSRVANAGIFNTKQLAYGLFDQMVHTGANVSTSDAYADVMHDITRVNIQKGTHPAARFGHLIGYDAQYYSYLWSQVFSADMFRSRFKKEGVFNPKPGRDYRNDILAPGGSIDPDELLLRFIGRAPTQDAFLESLGLNVTSAKSKGSPSRPKAAAPARQRRLRAAAW